MKWVNQMEITMFIDIQYFGQGKPLKKWYKVEDGWIVEAKKGQRTSRPPRLKDLCQHQKKWLLLEVFRGFQTRSEPISVDQLVSWCTDIDALYQARRENKGYFRDLSDRLQEEELESSLPVILDNCEKCNGTDIHYDYINEIGICRDCGQAHDLDLSNLKGFNIWEAK